MVSPEPDRLAVIRALAGHLEVQPLVAVMFLREFSVGEGIVLVVRLDQVLVYGARFPEGDARVWISDNRDATIRIDLLEGRLNGFRFISNVRQE